MQRWHYSGALKSNACVRLGVFDADGSIAGALAFGPPIDKRRSIRLVSGTPWNGMVELTRMALRPDLPKNSESRVLSVALRMLRKTYASLEWVLTFADATQCGDGAIYRALGALLTGVKRNSTMLRMPSGEVVSDKTLDNTYGGKKRAKDSGAVPLDGFQIRYIIPVRGDIQSRLTVPVLPYSAITDAGAAMYLGERHACEASGMHPRSNAEEGGSTPTRTLHTDGTPFPV